MIAPEPPPKPASGDLWASVIAQETEPALVALFQARREMGIEKYGTPLQANNGRNAVNDLAQELLDAIVYAEQVLTESAYRSDVWWWAWECKKGARLRLLELTRLQAHDREQLSAWGAL